MRRRWRAKQISAPRSYIARARRAHASLRSNFAAYVNIAKISRAQKQSGATAYQA